MVSKRWESAFVRKSSPNSPVRNALCEAGQQPPGADVKRKNHTHVAVPGNASTESVTIGPIGSATDAEICARVGNDYPGTTLGQKAVCRGRAEVWQWSVKGGRIAPLRRGWCRERDSANTGSARPGIAQFMLIFKYIDR